VKLLLQCTGFAWYSYVRDNGFGYSKDAQDKYMQSEQVIALQFAEVIASQKYTEAYAMTCREYQQRVTLSQMQAFYEHVIPEDWGEMTNIEAVGETLTNWPDKQQNDRGWVYVSLEGSVYPYSEGLFVLVSQSDDCLCICDVNFRRP
jgi:hypothetical protein